MTSYHALPSLQYPVLKTFMSQASKFQNLEMWKKPVFFLLSLYMIIPLHVPLLISLNGTTFLHCSNNVINICDFFPYLHLAPFLTLQTEESFFLISSCVTFISWLFYSAHPLLLFSAFFFFLFLQHFFKESSTKIAKSCQI